MIFFKRREANLHCFPPPGKGEEIFSFHYRKRKKKKKKRGMRAFDREENPLVMTSGDQPRFAERKKRRGRALLQAGGENDSISQGNQKFVSQMGKRGRGEASAMCKREEKPGRRPLQNPLGDL